MSAPRPTVSDLERGIAERVTALVDRLLPARGGHVYRDALAAVERPLLALVLERTGGNQLRAARLLGLNRNTLRERCKKLGLALPRDRRTDAAGAGADAARTSAGSARIGSDAPAPAPAGAASSVSVQRTA